jgi:flagellar motor switch protein FliN/FliY
LFVVQSKITNRKSKIQQGVLMPELSFDELSAFMSGLEPICQSLALALSENVGREAIFEVPTTLQQSIAQVTSSRQSVMQTTFSYPALTGDEGVLVFEERDAAIFVDLQEGGTGLNPPSVLLDDHMNRLADLMSGVIRGLGISLGSPLNISLEPGPCATAIEPLSLSDSFAVAGKAVTVEIPYHIEGVLDSTLRIYLTPDLARAITPAADSSSGESVQESMGTEFGQPDGEDINTASDFDTFQPFEPASAGAGSLPRGMELLMDIPLDVTVELGRVQMLIKDVLELSAGSIVELERVAGEPVDLLVNGRLVAKGEVVVIEDNFGIRVTEVISPADRANGTGKRG